MSELAEIIANEIRACGAIPFARFMELALYCPVYGYYEREEDTPGRHGDYYTSVSVGPLFGELLAFQFAEWLGQEVQTPLGAPASLPASSSKHHLAGKDAGAPGGLLVEAGAHRGELAKDILSWLSRHRPELFALLEYWIVEPSRRRREWQQEALSEFAPHVRWAMRPGEVGEPAPSAAPRSRVHGAPASVGLARPETTGAPLAAGRPKPNEFGAPGCAPVSPRIFFSNELLDAMPVHRFGWDAHHPAWYEWGVGLEGGQFVWTRLGYPGEITGAMECWSAGVLKNVTGQWPHSALEHATRDTHHAIPSELLAVLPDGFILEECPAAETWWSEAASSLSRGKLLSFDYGLAESLAPERKDGTLRAYRRHQVSSQLLDFPGEQDLTAHVNFTRLQAAGESAGLKTETFATQAQFLTSVASRVWENETAFGKWTPERTRQFQTLTHPNYLGRAFRVLVQSRE